MRKHKDGIKPKAEIGMMMLFHLIPSSSNHVIKSTSAMTAYRRPSRAELSPSLIVETFPVNHVSLLLSYKCDSTSLEKAIHVHVFQWSTNILKCRLIDTFFDLMSCRRRIVALSLLTPIKKTEIKQLRVLSATFIFVILLFIDRGKYMNLRKKC
jgi:hypothetical protein